MSQRSAIQRFVVPWLVAGLVFGCLAGTGLAAAQEAENEAPSAETAPAEKPTSQVVVYRLKEAKADAVVEKLKEMLSGDDSETVKLVREEKNNGIIVWAPKETHRRVIKLIEQLDVPAKEDEDAPDEPVTEVFYLKHARGDTIISAIRPVAPEAQVTFDSRLNCLIVFAPAEALRRVQQLVQTLDAPEEVQVKIFRLKYAPGDTIVNTMAPLVPDARMTFDARSNSLIVAASQEAFQRVEGLVETLDVPPDRDHDQSSQLQVYQLQRIDAAYAAGTIEFLMGPEESSRAADRVRIEADPENNRLLVYGPSTAHMEVKQLLAKIDLPPDPDRERFNQIGVYQLHHIEARNAVLCLQKLFGLSESSEVRIDADPESNRLFLYASLAVHLQVKEALERLDSPPEPGGGQQFKVFHLQDSDAEATAVMVSDLLRNEEVTISIDRRTNSLVASGSERVLEVIEALLLRLDEQEEHEEGPPLPSATYHVRVVWLASGLPEGIGAEPAGDLDDVLAELAKVGVTGVRQVGQAMVYTLPDGRFEITSSPMLDEAYTEMEISGELEERQGTPYLDIRLSAEQQKPVPLPFPTGTPESRRPTRTRTEAVVNLTTRIAAPYGHYVVLGVTPVRQTTSVFVVRVTESDPLSRPAKKEEAADR
jgi:type II secretory pathway component GspD/PulD (secretin)